MIALAAGLWMIGVPSVLGLLFLVVLSIYDAGKRSGMRKREVDAAWAFEIGRLRGRQEERFDQERERILPACWVGSLTEARDVIENDGRGTL